MFAPGGKQAHIGDMKLLTKRLPVALIIGALVLWDDMAHERLSVIMAIAEAVFIALVIYYSVGWLQRKPLDGN